MRIILTASLVIIALLFPSSEAHAHKMCNGPFNSELCPHPHLPSGSGSSSCALCNINSPLVEIISPRSTSQPAASTSHQLFFQNNCTDTPVRVGVTVHQGGTWTSKGWFTIPAAATIPLAGANTASAHFYYYAEEVNGTGFWGEGDQKAEVEGSVYGMTKVDVGTQPSKFTMRLNC